MQDHLKKSFTGKVYTLAGLDGAVFYVGCTIQDVPVRVAAHVSEARMYDRVKQYITKPNRKNLKIIELDFDISATVIDMVCFENENQLECIKKLKTIEIGWIIKYIDLGYQLTNREATSFLLRTNRKPAYVGQTFSTGIIKPNYRNGLKEDKIIIKETTQ